MISSSKQFGSTREAPNYDKIVGAAAAAAMQHRWVLPPLFFLLTWSLSLLRPLSGHEFPADGTVLELDDSTFDSAINHFDFVLVDFHAPWCGHCKRLSPELDIAAQVLAGLNESIVIAKLDADKYTKLASKYKIGGYPTLKLFMYGVPIDYTGSRKSDFLVNFLRKFVAPDVSLLESDSAIHSFVETAGKDFPIFIGFGLKESLIAEFGAKYKKSAWFAVAKGFSEEIMVAYDFDKVHALVALHPKYNEKNVFYGPFEGAFLGDFFQQNQLPLIVPINSETLRMMSNDERKIIVTFMEDELDEKSQKLLKVLRAAATANRDLIFAYVGVRQWEDFTDTFDVKKSKLPKIVVWDRNEEYHLVEGSESLDEEGDHGSQVSHFLEGYREGRTVKIKIGSPSLLSSINSVVGIRTASVIVILFAAFILFLCFSKMGENIPQVKETVAEVDLKNKED